MVLFHIAILIVTGLVILYTDHMAWQYFRGIKQTLDSKLVYRLHYAVWLGLAGMITTGVIMALPDLGDLLAQSYFYIKMGFVLLLVVDSIAITTLIRVATTTPYAELTIKQKAPLMLSGALSTIGWVGAALMGLLYFG